MNARRTPELSLSSLPSSSRVILAAGGLVWETAAQERLCIIHRPRYDDWSLPKGKWEVGESLEECAVREIFEETACRVALGPFLDIVRYSVKGASKFVFFWHMTLAERGRFTSNEEVDRMEWVRPEEAMARFTHEHERELVRRHLGSK